MNDKNNINDEEDFEIEFVEDNDNEEIQLEEVTDEDYEEDEEEFNPDEIEYNPEEDYVDDSKKKLTKNQIINRVMAGLGIAIAVFTAFYGVVAYGSLHKEDVSEPETTTAVVEEETTIKDGDFFVSTNSDENVSNDLKNLLKNTSLDEMKTGNSTIDSSISDILNLTCKSDMTTYDKVRNIYDYMMYYYDTKSSSYVDEDSIYDFSASYDYTSYFDMELMYRANKMIKDKTGDSRDYAAAFTVLLRRIGLEAYYIEGKMMGETDYETHGYTVVILDNKKYVFDVAEEDILSNDDKVEYKVFGKTFDELNDKYKEDGVEESIQKFSEFETLGAFSFSAKITSDGGQYSSASVGYSNGYNESGNSSAADDISVDISEKIYLKGNVSGSNSNTWKLLAKVYDDDMNYITESTLYTANTESSSNEITYTPARGGYVKLVYMVTDVNGRTCTISVLVKVNGYEPETTTNNNVASQGELNQ